ncbi:lactoferrin/transferrin family TonB-dependent receptor [Psychrobacter sp. I-STPA6b]|uniref:lactoferrin/transferrin family TonB-dependent receptor n=1 Tax=Psychrobacter sp. I-STPA6b TaxID=2585718 RepID=UPI001D0C2EFC|nr:lactoferrin/transferrin family TonB-dependent receptor [Psychrobacter sp. I-STPA6b]
MLHNSSLPAYHPLAKAVALALFTTLPLQAVAEVNNTATINEAEDAPHTELEAVVIQVGSRARPENKDITGLGQITKTAETLKEQQVESIRDLTRYDAGVAVNESVGRGTSSGFSIRGAEKERVAVMVDGLSQGETIKRYGNGSGTESGAKNEVEFENLKLVEISKGANSTYAGSGALGGAVMMQTKDTSDFVSDDALFGGRVKAGYTSKDNRYVYSAGLGGQKDGWEGFVQYTKRKGNELKPHDDIYNLPATTVNNVVTGVDDSKIFIIDNRFAENYNALNGFKVPAITETVSFSAEDLTGPDRRIPNPMDYESESFLSKAGYRFNDEHYVGVVFEDTKQTYDVRNMFKYQYHSTDFSETRSDKHPESPIRSGMIAGIDGFPKMTTPIMSDFYKYTPTYFVTDIHHNKRQGLEYKYTPANTSIIDDLHLQLDKQLLNTSSNNDLLNCAKWPSVDRNCSATEAGQYTHHNEFKQSFDTKRINLLTHKNFDIADTSHNLSIATGYKTTVYNNSDLNQRNAVVRYLDRNNPEKDVTLSKALVYDGKNESLEENVHVDTYYPIRSIHLSSSSLAPLEHDITHKNYFIGINDSISLTDKLGMSLGLRYDSNTFESDLSNIIINTQYTGNKDTPLYSNSDFKNTSYNLGLTYTPTYNLELAYKYSTGFRVPSFGEQLGITGGIKSNEVQPPLKAETAQNHEIGAIYHTDFGYIKGSYFRTSYDNFIDRATKLNPDGSKPLGYTNYQNVNVHGFDLGSEVDLHSLWEKVPAGLQANLSAGIVKMRDSSGIGEQLDNARSYAFDMVQPLRVIYGISYVSPNDKWGMALNTTYSAAKEADELNQQRHTGKLKGQTPTSNLVSPSWRVTDLTGHYRFNDNITLRGGVYNIFDYGYLTWESLRQNKEFADTTGVDDTNLLAAPGRNYGLSVEFTF